MRALVTILACTTALILVGCEGALKAAPTTPQDLSKIAGWHGAAPNAPDAFRFIVVADRTGGHEEGAWEKAIADINRLRPDFIVCVGDLIEGYKDDDSLIRSQWDEFDTLTSRLDAPFFYCTGNHDVTGDIPRAIYTQRHGVAGKTYYSFDYRSCHFIVLDSDAIVSGNKAVAPAEWAWLEKDLVASRTAAHTFIMFHHPLYTLPEWAKMRAMLDPKKTTIFNGHEHHLSYDVEDGIPYFILASTSTKSSNNRETGSFQSYAHVVVNRGRPTVSIIPVGQILPHNFIDRHASDMLDEMVAKAQLTPITRTGGDVTLQLTGPDEGRATVTLTWSAADGWFAAGVPAPETVTLPAKANVTHSYRINPSEPQAQAPVLTLECKLDLNGQTTQRTAKIPVPVIAMLDVPRISGITIDGDLADWGSVPVTTTNTRTRVTYHPEAWTGPDDSALSTRLGCDDKALYLAFDVNDEDIVARGAEAWEQDGVEVFWDPRPDGQRTAQFQGPCRHLMIPVPKSPGKTEVSVLPAGSIKSESLSVACVRRPGGYVVELAVPFEAIADGFRPSPGRTLYFEAIVNDEDTAGAKNTMTNLVLSGDDNASRRTSGYAKLTFQP
jgi:hypothetical protein